MGGKERKNPSRYIESLAKKLDKKIKKEIGKGNSLALEATEGTRTLGNLLVRKRSLNHLLEDHGQPVEGVTITRR